MPSIILEIISSYTVNGAPCDISEPLPFSRELIDTKKLFIDLPGDNLPDSYRVYGRFNPACISAVELHIVCANCGASYWKFAELKNVELVEFDYVESITRPGSLPSVYTYTNLVDAELTVEVCDESETCSEHHLNTILGLADAAGEFSLDSDSDEEDQLSLLYRGDLSLERDAATDWRHRETDEN
ncbi:putative RNA silencing suppressor [Solanum nodiflorum mottle virus]|uniref:Putative RNA silencing suppressor n=1 Tax=Solanum nodiflorum mottle virus TaxID=12471 RepID=A0A1P7XK87_9VIRU|nr:putative RNA silencing suppressor [Solanum nodiflorum mottle virus]AHB64346.1 putative RNA silencing suppressor [Solanum nodiflorum mottle virus]